MSHRSWVFTTNNYTSDDVEALEQLADTDAVVYMVFGREVGESGTPHLQGCVTFAKTHRRTAVSDMIPRSFLEPAYAVEKAREYCKKSDPTPFVKDKRKQGARTDLETAVQTMLGQGMSALVDNHPMMYVRYHGGFERLQARLQKPRDLLKPPVVTWIYGATGTGKSRYVWEKEKNSLYVTMETAQWWEGYEQQQAILIDDMRGDFAKFHVLLRILDRYPFRAGKKGTSVQLNSERIYITSCSPPHGIYNRENRKGEDIAQLYRRITEIYETVPTFSSLEGRDGFIRNGVLFERRSKDKMLEQAASLENSPTAPGFVWPHNCN